MPYVDDVLVVAQTDILQQIGLVQIHERAVVVHIFVLVLLARKDAIGRSGDCLICCFFYGNQELATKQSKREFAGQ